MTETLPTWYTAVPTVHQSILERVRSAPHMELPTLRFIGSSSASLAPAVMEGLESGFGAPVVEAYGMTEAALQMSSNPLPPARRKPGSVGNAAGPEVALFTFMISVTPRRSAAGFLPAASLAESSSRVALDVSVLALRDRTRQRSNRLARSVRMGP